MASNSEIKAVLAALEGAGNKTLARDVRTALVKSAEHESMGKPATRRALWAAFAHFIKEAGKKDDINDILLQAFGDKVPDVSGFTAKMLLDNNSVHQELLDIAGDFIDWCKMMQDESF